MRTSLRFGAALALTLVVLSSCYPFLDGLPPGAVDGPSIQHVPWSGSFSYTVDTGATPRDVYFVFTNPDRTTDVAAAPSIAGGSITVDGRSLAAPVPQLLPSFNTAPTTMNERVAEFNRNPGASMTSRGISWPQSVLVSGQAASADAVNDVRDFVLDMDVSGNPTVTVPATCRLVRKQVDLNDGRVRSLSIWVANTTTGTVTPATVTALADRFLKSPADVNDIYHWTTAVVGEPWGPQGLANLIPWDANSTITILLADLNPTYPASSYTVGHFWAKDNFTAADLPGSNQRIMFYIDATLSSYGTVSSDSLIFSTLAHEFQHMIQFYQKQVVRGAAHGADTWINEMCSMIMEDLVADKQGVEGPRGVTPPGDGSAGTPGTAGGDRIPDFNRYSYMSLVRPTSFGLVDYSISYAFGAWLARNYGGAGLLRNIVQSPQTDESAVVNAVIRATGNPKENLAGLLQRWSAAVLLSDTTAAPSGYRYNTGSWFQSSIGGQSFNLGSINFSNYTPTLTVFSVAGTQPSSSYHSSNLYYEAATSLSGARTWTITVPDGVLMNVVIR